MIDNIGGFLQHNLVVMLAVVLVPMKLIVLRVFFFAVTGKLKMEPCPPGLEEAERVVESKRQQLFGGELRKPMFAHSWKAAYERELQADTERAQKFAEKYLVVA